MRDLMIRVQDEARTICSLQEEVPKLKEQLSEAKGVFKGKERKALAEQIQQTEQEISERLDNCPIRSKRMVIPMRRRLWQPTKNLKPL